MAQYNTILWNEGTYNTPEAPPPPPPPPPVPGLIVTVREIYNEVAFVMLEDYQLVLGTFTDAQFLDYLEEAILEFAQQCGMVKHIFSQMVLNAQAVYIIPDDILQVQYGFIGGVWIERTSLDELQNGEFQWARRSGYPTAWFEDGLPTSRAQLFPIPDYTGTTIVAPRPPFGDYGSFHTDQRNYTVVGSAGPNPIALTLDDNVPDVVPASFTPYLVFRILWRVFSLDGEAHDSQRAIYCLARWQEGIALAQSIMMEAVSDNSK